MKGKEMKNKLNKIVEEKFANTKNRTPKYGLRKLSIGVVSCILGYACVFAPSVSGANIENPSAVLVEDNQVASPSPQEKNGTGDEKNNPQGPDSKSNPDDQVEEKKNEVKDNTKYTVTYSPGLTDVNKATTISPKFKNKVNQNAEAIPQGATFKLGKNVEGAEINSSTGVISYTPNEKQAGKIVSFDVVLVFNDKSQANITATIQVNKVSSKAPLIKEIFEGQTKITGTGEKGAKIELKVVKGTDGEGDLIGNTTVKDNGTWEVTVSGELIKKNYKIRAIQTEEGKAPTPTFKLVEEKKSQEQQPQQELKLSINDVTEGDAKITGNYDKEHTLLVTIKSKTGEKKFETGGVLDPNGTWTVNAEEKLEAGDEITVNEYTQENQLAKSVKKLVIQKKSDKNKQQTEEGQDSKKNPGQENSEDNGHTTAKEKSETPTINSVAEGDATISGTGKAGAKIHVTKTIGNSPQGLIMGENIVVDDSGKWTLSVPKGKELKKDDVVLVVQQEEGKEISQQVSSVVAAKKDDSQEPNKKPQDNQPSQEDEDEADKQAQAKLTINPAYEGQIKISGTYNPGDTIGVEIRHKDKTYVYTAKQTTDGKGNWTAESDEALKVGDEIIVTQFGKNTYKNAERTLKVTAKPTSEVEQEKSQSPKVNPVKEGDAVISGTGVAGAKISLSKVDKESRKAIILATDVVVNGEGNWSVTIDASKNFREGDTISAFQKQDGKGVSDSTDIVVAAKENKPSKPESNPAPENQKPNNEQKESSTFPLVSDVKAGDKQVSGKGIAEAEIKITVISKDKSTEKTYTTKVNADGTWKVDLEKELQPEDDVTAIQTETNKKSSPKVVKSVAKKIEHKPNKPESTPESGNQKPNNEQKGYSSFPLVFDVKAGDKQVGGKGIAGAEIKITVISKDKSTEKTYTTKVNADGTWKVDLEKELQPEDDVTAIQTETNKKSSPKVVKSVAKKIEHKPNKPESTPESGNQKPNKPESTPESGSQKPDKPESTPESGNQKPNNPESTPESGNQKPNKPESTPESGNKKPNKPQQKPEVKKPEVKKPSNDKTPEQKPQTKPQKNAKKPSVNNKNKGLSLQYEQKTVRKGSVVKIKAVFRDKDGKIIKMPEGTVFSLEKNSPANAKINSKTGELTFDTTGYKNGDRIVLTVVATIKGSTTKVFALFTESGKTTQPNKPTTSTENDTVLKTKVVINVEKKDRKDSQKAKISRKKKMPKAGYENEVMTLAAAALSVVSGFCISKKKNK